MHRNEEPTEWKAFPPLTFPAKCFPHGFTVAVPRCLPWPCTGCWSSERSVWGNPAQSSPVPHSQAPGAVTQPFPAQCCSSYSACPLLSALQRHSCPSFLKPFSPLCSCSIISSYSAFSGYWGWRTDGKRLIHHTPDGCQGVKKRWQGLSSLAAIICWGGESVFATAYTLQQGRTCVEMIRVSSCLLLTLVKSGTRDLRATEIMVHFIVRVHNQFSFLSCSPSSWLYLTLLWLTRAPKLQVLISRDSQRQLLLKQHAINTAVNFRAVFLKALYEVRQLWAQPHGA